MFSVVDSLLIEHQLPLFSREIVLTLYPLCTASKNNLLSCIISVLLKIRVQKICFHRRNLDKMHRLRHLPDHLLRNMLILKKLQIFFRKRFYYLRGSTDLRAMQFPKSTSKIARQTFLLSFSPLNFIPPSEKR